MFNKPKDVLNFIHNKEPYETENEIFHLPLELLDNYFDAIMEHLRKHFAYAKRNISFDHFPIISQCNENFFRWSLRFKRGEEHYGNDFEFAIEDINVDKNILARDILDKKYRGAFNVANQFILETYNENIELISLGKKFENNVLLYGWTTQLSKQYYLKMNIFIERKVVELLKVFGFNDIKLISK